MAKFDRITSNPNIMGGKACIRNMRITVSLVLNLLAKGMTREAIIAEYPSLESDDIDQALMYVA